MNYRLLFVNDEGEEAYHGPVSRLEALHLATSFTRLGGWVALEVWNPEAKRWEHEQTFASGEL